LANVLREARGQRDDHRRQERLELARLIRSEIADMLRGRR